MASKPTVRLHPLAEHELITAFRWYEERNDLVAQILVNEFEAALDLIKESPGSWPRISRRCHRFVLRRFPFSIVYMLRGGCIEIIALAHHRRRPGYWAGRT